MGDWYLVTIKARIGRQTFAPDHYLIRAVDGAGVDDIIKRHGLARRSGDTVSWEPLNDLTATVLSVSALEVLQ